MSRLLGDLRPTHALLFIVLLTMAAAEWHRQSTRDALVAEREGLLDTRETVLSLERELLLARTEESEALATGRSSLRERLTQRQKAIQERVDSVIRELIPVLGAPEIEALVGALAKYRQSVSAELYLSTRIGREGGASGLLQELQRLERRLESVVQGGRIQLQLLELQIQQREYVATLKTSQATSLLQKIDVLRDDLQREKARGSELANALDDYRRQVESVMAASLEMELLRSEASLRFDRLPPIFRDIEMRLDQRLESSAGRIAELRRRSAWQVAVFLGLAFLVFAFRARSERRETLQTLKGIRQLVGGMKAFAAGADENDLTLPEVGDLGKVSVSFLSMAGQIRSQMSIIDQERRRAEEAFKAKADFLARVSHELRTPLHGIMGMSELLGWSRLDSDQRHLVEILNHSGATLLAVVNDLLDFERLEAGKLALELQTFKPAELFEDVVASHAPTAHSKGLELVLNLPPVMPRQVEGDPLRLNQILNNLLGNALKFTETGYVELVVHGFDTIRPQRVRLRFAVRDTGPGVPESLKEEIFEPFAQGEQFLQRKYGGSGLGLSIVHELTALMGGSVGLSSDTSGAVFEVSVELKSAAEQARLPSPVLDGLRLFVVDAHGPSLGSLGNMLSCLGAEVECYGDSAVAIEMLSAIGAGKATVDAVILGYSATEQEPDLSDLKSVLEQRRIPSVHILPITPWALELQQDMEQEDVHSIQSKPIRRPAQGSALAQAVQLVAGRGLEQTVDSTQKSAGGEQPVELSGRILLVEDNPINCEVVQLMLEDSGCRIEVAENGRAAVERIQKESFDLILMDCQMPVMNGFEATLEIRQLDDPVRAGIPIVALTASALPEEQQRCMDVGMDGVISKPADQETLLDKVREYLAPGDSGRRAESA